eukprot:1156184-Pelagomonas_calceolata.AAC.10
MNAEDLAVQHQREEGQEEALLDSSTKGIACSECYYDTKLRNIVSSPPLTLSCPPRQCVQ